MAVTEKFIVGVFNDDHVTLEAAYKLKKSGVSIYEVYSPFPIHGIDDALGYKRSRLPKAAFMFGGLGTFLAILMQTWMIGYDWPMNIGGKNFISPPNFIPLTFEITVLLSALGMVTTFMLASKLGPGSNKVVFDKRFSDDKFVVAISLDKNEGKSEASIEELLKSAGAEEVSLKEI